MAKEKKSAQPSTKPLRLVILDSHAILHRAYHALPDFSNSKGEPTGALYGLMLMLFKIVDALKPDYIIAARDLPGATHRHELFEAYKATRIKAEDELIAQLEVAPKVFEAFGIPVYQHTGFEADDVVGTIVRELSARTDIETIIATGDMDTLQLVGPRVRVFTLRKGLSDTVLYDAEGVRERYGFGPERVVDYKALRGDPSDNIPGIKGIGEKTATELIKEFGSLDDIYKALEQDPEAFGKLVKPRVVELLKNGKSDAAFSKTLATIHPNVPLSFELPKRQWHLGEHAPTIMTLCDRLEFKSLKERVGRLGAGQSDQSPKSDFGDSAEFVADPAALRETSLALWLLHSDITNPGLEDILRETHTEDFEKAREAIFAELRATGRLGEVYEKIERPLIPIVERMNATGVYVDKTHLNALADEYGKELGVLAGKIYKYAGHEFNINSPKQLGVVLYDELKINPVKQKKTAGGARTTREEELAKLAPLHPIIDDILGYRELQKLLSTYIEKMPALIGSDGRLHAEFLQTGTTTGRMGCQNPNLQNIPIKSEYGRRIRTAFAAPKGRVLVALDYSQIELRIAAGLSGDKKLVQIFKEGGDVHAAVAAQVFNVPPELVDHEMRRRAKVINFGILYGMGVNALRTNLGATVSREEAAAYLSEYFKNFSGLARFIEHTKAEASRLGYTETLFGRRRYFAGFKSSIPGLRAQAERMAVNAPMQGTQSDIIKLAMVEADGLIEKNGWRGKAELVLQIHDELVYELAEDIAQTAARAIRDVMESVAPKDRLSGVPILAEAAVGSDWGSLQKVSRA
ncbi:MAG: DNA polymerase [Patescibacteria group bacterium]